MLIKQVSFGVALMLVVGLVPIVASSQPSSDALPVIVVFRDDMSMQHFEGFYRPDDRARANPPAWTYLDRGVAGAVHFLETRHGFRADHVYSAALRGFAARLNARQIAELENDPNVTYIEADGTMSISAQTLPWGIDRIDADLSSTKAGDGGGSVSISAYIIDTGIDTAHSDLNTSTVRHVNFAGGPNKDCNGHGTHVAGTVAARDNASDVVGVAPGAPLTGVKVLGCGGSGSTSGVIKGVDWVTANATKPAVANMSLRGGANDSLDTAVRNSANSGVFYAIAAGNDGANACNYSPARAGAGTNGTNNGIMTVAATDNNNKEASWSNYGTCVDIWAPGVGILSTRKGGGTTTMSGTSMAAPHVAGTGALYLSNAVNTGASAATVEGDIKTAAAKYAADPESYETGTSKDGRAITLDYAGYF